MDRPKLLLITSNFKMGWGGISSYAYDLIDALGENYSIDVITGDKGDYKPKYCNSIKTFNFKNFKINNAKELLSLIDYIKPNIILNSNVVLFLLISPFVNNCIKIISISHFVNGPLSWAAGINAKYQDSIISLSTYGKIYLDKKYRIKNGKNIVIKNFSKAISEFVDNKKTNEPQIIVYPGGCSYQKSPEIVAKALLKLLKDNIDFRFYWIGDTKVAGSSFPIFNISKVEDLFSKEDKRIAHIGRINREESRLLLSKANIFILPSRGEGLPISLIEAMSSGCIPIISNAKHGSLDVINNKKNGLIIPQGNSNLLYNTIKDILIHKDKYKYIYKNSYETYKKSLSKTIWRGNMNSVLLKSPRHDNRTTFNKYKYKTQLLLYKKDMIRYWFNDRQMVLKQFILFKYLFFLSKIWSNK